MSIVTQADPTTPAGSARALSERRPLGDRSFQILALACGLLVLVILVLIAVSTTSQASSWFSAEGLKIFTNNWNPANNQFGALAFIYGTAITAVIALIMAVPVSIGIALLLTEVVPYRWSRPIVYVIDLLAVVPSVVWGLWGIIVFAPWIQHIYTSIASGVNGIPVLDNLFGAPTSGASFFTAGIILAFMITPIVTSLSREVIATVPQIDREGAYALGATRWEMIRGAVWPHSQGGIVGAVLLGLGRAMGETIAVALVIGSSAVITSHLFAPGYNMAAVIANQFGEATGVFRAALMGIGVLLFAFTIIINVIAHCGRGALRPAQEGCLMAVVAEQQQLDLREPKGWRRTSNRIVTSLMVLAFVVVVIPLGFVLVTTVVKGASIISWQFLTSSIPPNVAPADVGGMGPAIVGTIEITALATIMAVPLGILGAIYLNEYGGNNWLAALIGFFSDVMTGVPSIIMGLFIFTIWVLHFGFSGFAGALALGCLMLPIVIRSTYEMLRLVPNALREGSYALGATKARVTMTVVLPAALGGIVSGAMLAVARAVGETAPLLFTILIVTTVNKNPFSGANTSLPSQIFVNANSPFVGAQARGWGAALTLIVIAFVLMVVARFITARFSRFSR